MPNLDKSAHALSVAELLESGAAVKSANGLLVRSSKISATFLVYALTDLDGTVNDEHLPENQRLSSIHEAKEAFSALARNGVLTGICTARSSGEARHYQRHLEISGPLISENGAVVIFPDGSKKVFGNLETLQEAVERISARLQRKIPNSIDFASLEEAWEKERRGESPVFLGHDDLESLRRAADRCASCFLVGLSLEEKQVAGEIASEMGLTSFGELLHLIPAGADKGRALEALNSHLLEMPPEHGLHPDRVVEIVFGNGENDLPLFEQALRGGGAAVLVGDATTPNGFHFDTTAKQVPAGVITFKGLSHGNAIRASLPTIRGIFAEKYGLNLSL